MDSSYSARRVESLSVSYAIFARAANRGSGAVVSFFMSARMRWYARAMSCVFA